MKENAYHLTHQEKIVISIVFKLMKEGINSVFVSIKFSERVPMMNYHIIKELLVLVIRLICNMVTDMI